VRLGIVTDSHIAPDGTPPGVWHNSLHYDRAVGLLDRAVGFLRERRVDAVVMLGDLTNFGDEASIARAVAVFATVGVPVMVVPGNHDCEFGTAVFCGHVDRLGAPSIATAGGVRKLGVCAVVGLTDLAPDGGGGLLIGDVPSGGWGDGPLVLLTHFPLLDRRAETLAAGFKYAGGFRDGGVARRLFDRRDPAIVLHGHLHLRDTTARQNVLQIGCPALIEPPHEATVVEIVAGEGDCRVAVEHVSLVASDVARVPVLGPARGEWRFGEQVWRSMGADNSES
jgi:predicted phosphodiesterase